MCNFFSAVVLQSGEILWDPMTDSHNDIVEKYHLNDGVTAFYRQNFCRIEFIPPKGSLKSLDFSQWKINIDEDIVPDWFDHEKIRPKLERIVKGMMVTHQGKLLDGKWILLDGSDVKETANSRAVPMVGINIIEFIDGIKRWYLNSQLHRLDGPAVEWADGSKVWYVEGKLHRLDGPAREWAYGSKEWWVEGKCHRLDGPAREWAYGSKEWWVEGKCHRLDGPACEYADGSKEWWVEGKLHRLDGPAVEYANGYKAWYIEGKLHRLDGPACEYADGSKLWFVEGELHRLNGPACEWANGSKEWYVEGKKLTEEKFNNYTLSFFQK